MGKMIWCALQERSVFKGLSLEIFSNDLPACLVDYEMWSGTKSCFIFHPGWAEFCESGKGICITYFPPETALGIVENKI